MYHYPTSIGVTVGTKTVTVGTFVKCNPVRSTSAESEKGQ